MRLFIALNLSDGAKEGVYDAARPLREAGLPVRWLDPATYHLTLKFLGNPHPDLTPRVSAAIDEVGGKSRPFSMEIRGFGAFPTIRRPRVLWAGVEPVLALRCLKQDVEWGLASLGFNRETSAFHPHITVGRASPETGAGAFRGLDALVADLGFRHRIDVTTVELMRSHLSRAGPRYSVLSSAALKPAESAQSGAR
ncbi:MAG: RNA 2',3'-cyclic phosphodiesterase [Gammaproteobacteria bacterium]|nr:RNA 2',3'-cyclic phosphodiesterase [Gammaproteobacteria bacterium]